MTLSSASGGRGGAQGAPQGAHSAVVNVGSRGGAGLGLTEHDMENINNPRFLEVVINWLSGFRNDTEDFTKLQLRMGIEPIWLPVAVAYALLVVFGVLLNVISYHRLERLRSGHGLGRGLSLGHGLLGHGRYRGTFSLLANICAANAMQSAVVIPASVFVLMVQNWVYGPAGCYLLPMLQGLPMHVQMMTFAAVGYDRYKYHGDPAAPPSSPKVISCSVWIVSALIVLPYPVYTTYLDLGSLIRDQLHGIGICILNLAEDMHTYVVSTFIFTYIIPGLLSVWFHGGTFLALRRQARCCALRVRMHEDRLRGACVQADPRFPSEGPSPVFALTAPRQSRQSSRGGSLQLDAEHDLLAEQRSQRYLAAMNAVFALCLLPLGLLRLLKHQIQETYANSFHYDVVYCLVVFIAYLPSVTTPILISFWTSTMPTWGGRLRACFCLSYPKLSPHPGAGDVGVLLRSARPSLLAAPPAPPAPPPHCPTSPIAALGGPRSSRGSVHPHLSPPDVLLPERVLSAVV